MKADFLVQGTIPYLRDIYDHTVNFIESLESIRDSLSGLMDIYMSSVSNRVNLEVRALTVVAMLFMPATLIAGIFGMNFQHYAVDCRTKRVLVGNVGDGRHCTLYADDFLAQAVVKQ